MTYDELLEEINKDIDQTPLVKDYYPVKALFALRAVVELHKPMDLYAHLCEGCYEEESGHSDYPCATIQAIQKELK